MQVVTLTAALNASADDVPSEFVLLRAGENEYDGGRLLFDAEAATSVMSTYRKRGIQLTADYEHQSLNKALTGPIPNAAKKWTPEVRDGALVAADIQWTSTAKKMLAEGEYRYFSIACRVDPRTSRVSQLINFALTNNPAANCIEPLVAASLNFAESTAEDNSMKTVSVALGLSANAEEADALSAISSLKDFERNVITLSGKSSRGEALGALTGLISKAERADRAEAELVTLKAASARAEVDALIDAAVSDGRVPPAKRESMLALSQAAGVAGLKACLDILPKQALTAAESVKEAQSVVGSDVLTAADIRIALSLNHDLDELRKAKSAWLSEQSAHALARKDG